MKMATIAGQMLDKPYRLGACEDAYDCLSFILSYYEAKGINFGTQWNGWTKENYAERWESGEGRTEFYTWMHSLGKSVGRNYMLDGDLLVLDTEEGVTPAIYLGSGNIMIVTIEQGVFVMPVNMLQCQIK